MTATASSNLEEPDQPEPLDSANSPPPSKRSKKVEDTTLSQTVTYSILSTDVPDFGLYLIETLRRRSATHDGLKKKLLTARFVPDKTWVAPKHLCGKQNRTVSADFFNSQLYPSIRYSVNKDGLYCAACVLFGNQKIVLTTEPLKDWSNAR